MRMRVLILLPMLALTGCAATGGGKLSACDGKHLRPANSYGSVLAPVTTGQAATPSPAADGGAKPRRLSSAAPPSWYGSCA
jgi:hypothetical protein